MIRVRKRMPKRTPGDGLPQGVLGRREVVYQLTGQQRFAPGIYHDRRYQHDRRRPLWRQVMVGNFRCLKRTRGRRRDDRLRLPTSKASIWVVLLVTTLAAVGLRLFGNWK
jgi:hypothetical protein